MKISILVCLLLLSQPLQVTSVSQAAVNSKTTNAQINGILTITSIKLNDKSISIKNPVYLNGKYLQLPANEFFTAIGITPEIDKSSGLYTIKFDGNTIEFNPKTGKGTSSFIFGKEIISQHSGVSLIKNNIVYLSWPYFPMHRLGLAMTVQDVKGKVGQKALLIYNSTDSLGTMEKTFKVQDSSNSKLEWKQERDLNDPLKLYGSMKINVKSVSNQSLYALDSATGKKIKHTPYLEIGINNMFYANRPVKSNEMNVFEMGLYQNGNLVKTLISVCPPKVSSGSTRFNTTLTSFDEIRAKSYYVNTDDCKAKLSGIPIEKITNDEFLSSIRLASSFSWHSHLVSNQLELSAYDSLYSGATINPSGAFEPIFRNPISDYDDITQFTRINSVNPSFGNEGSILMLSSTPSIFILYDEKNYPIKILYLE